MDKKIGRRLENGAIVLDQGKDKNGKDAVLTLFMISRFDEPKQFFSRHAEIIVEFVVWYIDEDDHALGGYYFNNLKEAWKKFNRIRVKGGL